MFKLRKTKACLCPIKTKACMWLHKKSGEEMNLHRLTLLMT